ncbi:MAG TPA: hypothetical protein VMV37_10230 [Gammaproteobacteria bacterium]|nr:hypothetical protein [Gammaproteobacteria bacterium]
MKTTNERPTEPEAASDFERSAKQAFDASVRGVDAATRARLVVARERALESAGGARSNLGWSWSLAPSGALAAAAVVAVLVLGHHPRSTEVGPQQFPNDLEILLGNEDLGMLDDDIDFYSWLEDQPDFAAPAGNGDGVG